MSTEPEIKPSRRKYHVKSVEKVDPPDGMPAGNWHRYVIGEGRSRIEGFRPGSLKAVTEHAETVAQDLNERTTSGKSPYAVSKRK